MNNKNYAPIVLFVYNRLWHTQQTVEALLKNDLAAESDLFIYSDGKKTPNDNGVDDIRRYIKNIKGFKTITIIEREKNWGLADNIVDGITTIVNNYGKIIVLEDDILTSVGFLKYMNDALNFYSNKEKVLQISGYVYPHSNLCSNNTFFMRVLACWGWGTWKRAWDNFTFDINFLFNKIDTIKKINNFNIKGNAHFYEQLKLNYNGDLYTWAVRWYASWFLKKGLCLFPKVSLTKNIGHDNSGENCNTNNIFDTNTIGYINIKPISIKENFKIKKQINELFKNNFSIKEYTSKEIFKDNIRYFAKKVLYKLVPELKKYNNYISQQNFINNYKFKNIIKNAKIYSPFKLSETIIGEYTYIAPNSIINKTNIGKFCSIGPNFLCGYGIHPINGISTSPMFYSTKKQNGFSLTKIDKIDEQKDIKIGNDVFIGANVTILDGVEIGNGAVIGAGAVVVNNIPDYAIAVGVPAKVVKFRFEEKTIESLLKIKWWNFSEDQLLLVEKYFFDVQRFVNELNKDSF